MSNVSLFSLQIIFCILACDVLTAMAWMPQPIPQCQLLATLHSTLSTLQCTVFDLSPNLFCNVQPSPSTLTLDPHPQHSQFRTYIAAISIMYNSRYSACTVLQCPSLIKLSYCRILTCKLLQCHNIQYTKSKIS